MKNTSLYILLLLLFASASSAARGNNDSVFKKAVVNNISLLGTSDHKRQTIKESTKPLRLFIFLSPECPMCRQYSLLLKSLYKQYGQEVEFYGIVPGNAYTVEEVKKYRDEYGIAFPLVIDEAKALSNYLQVAVTPQVILLNSNYQMVYKGAIDNRLMALGKQRVKPTEDFLNNAISQGLHNKIVAVKRTKAVGCKINDY